MGLNTCNSSTALNLYTLYGVYSPKRRYHFNPSKYSDIWPSGIPRTAIKLLHRKSRHRKRGQIPGTSNRARLETEALPALVAPPLKEILGKRINNMRQDRKASMFLETIVVHLSRRLTFKILRPSLERNRTRKPCCRFLRCYTGKDVMRHLQRSAYEGGQAGTFTTLNLEDQMQE